MRLSEELVRTGIGCVGAMLLLLAGCADAGSSGELDDNILPPLEQTVGCEDTNGAVDDDAPADPAPVADPPAADPPAADPPAADPAPTPPPASEPPASQPPAPSGGGDMPKIPEPTGACPEFRTGTATIGGLSGIAVQAGAKKNGTGALLFYWHGTGSTSGEVRMFPAQRELLAEGGIIISPQRSLGSGGDCSGTGTFSKDDMKVADLIVACAVKNHGINPRRIYTTGCSAGGLQAGCFASLRSSYVAAAVPNSGGIVVPQRIQDPAHIPALMTMHGSQADTVIVTFSQTSATLGRQFATAGGFVLNCNHGGGHCQAPSALQAAGWQFMKDHPFGTKPSPYLTKLPSAFPSYCKPVSAGATAAPTGGRR